FSAGFNQTHVAQPPSAVLFKILVDRRRPRLRIHTLVAQIPRLCCLFIFLWILWTADWAPRKAWFWLSGAEAPSPARSYSCGTAALGCASGFPKYQILSTNYCFEFLQTKYETNLHQFHPAFQPFL